MNEAINNSKKYMFKFKLLIFLFLIPQVWMFTTINDLNTVNRILILIFTILFWLWVYTELNKLSLIYYLMKTDHSTCLNSLLIYKLSRLVAMPIALIIYFIAIFDMYSVEFMLSIFPILAILKRLLPHVNMIGDNYVVKGEVLYLIKDFTKVTSNEDNKISCFINEEEIQLKVPFRDKDNFLQALKGKINNNSIIQLSHHDPTAFSSLYFNIKQSFILLIITILMFYPFSDVIAFKYYINEDQSNSFIFAIIILIIIFTSVIKNHFTLFSNTMVNISITNKNIIKKGEIQLITFISSVGLFYYYYFVRMDLIWILSLSIFFLFIYSLQVFFSVVSYKRKIKRQNHDHSINGTINN